MVTTSHQNLAFDREPCPHNEEDCYWETEWWREGKTTGYEHRICRDCGFHVERRPLKALTDMVLPVFELHRQSESEPNVFDVIGNALLAMDTKRWEQITEDMPQEVGHGENVSKDAPSPG